MKSPPIWFPQNHHWILEKSTQPPQTTTAITGDVLAFVQFCPIKKRHQKWRTKPNHFSLWTSIVSPETLPALYSWAHARYMSSPICRLCTRFFFLFFFSEVAVQGPETSYRAHFSIDRWASWVSKCTPSPPWLGASSVHVELSKADAYVFCITSLTMSIKS